MMVLLFQDATRLARRPASPCSSPAVPIWLNLISLGGTFVRFSLPTPIVSEPQTTPRADPIIAPHRVHEATALDSGPGEAGHAEGVPHEAVHLMPFHSIP